MYLTAPHLIATLPPAILLFLVSLQRLGELLYARHNTRRLLVEGAYEVGAGHYPLFVLLHTSWLATLWSVVLWQRPVLQPWPVFGYLLLQLFRAWIMISLGRFWTTRILILPDAPLVRRGPYRFLRHPNYLLVCLEIALLPLALGPGWTMGWIALIFSLANAGLLARRRQIEERALAPRRYLP